MVTHPLRTGRGRLDSYPVLLLGLGVELTNTLKPQVGHMHTLSICPVAHTTAAASLFSWIPVQEGTLVHPCHRREVKPSGGHSS